MQRYEDFYTRSTTKKILYFLTGWIALLSKLIPKKKGLLAFGSMNGYAVADNAKYLFIESLEKSNVFFITKNKEVLKTEITNGSLPVYAYSLKGLAIQLFAEKVFYTHGIYDFIPPLIWGSQKHNLWHGVPLKEIGPGADWKASSDLMKRLKIMFYRTHGYIYYMSCDYVYCPFSERMEDYKRYFAVSNPTIIIEKQPRNALASKNSASKCILYAPTYRGPKFPNFDYSELFSSCGIFDTELQDFLEKNQLTLILRPHPIDIEKLKKISFPPNIKLDTSLDLYQTLKNYKAVITDYSSICLDCEEIGIPYYFITPDLVQYDTTVGLSDSIKSLMNSKTIQKISDICIHQYAGEALDSCISNDKPYNF